MNKNTDSMRGFPVITDDMPHVFDHMGGHQWGEDVLVVGSPYPLPGDVVWQADDRHWALLVKGTPNFASLFADCAGNGDGTVYFPLELEVDPDQMVNYLTRFILSGNTAEVLRTATLKMKAMRVPYIGETHADIVNGMLAAEAGWDTHAVLNAPRPLPGLSAWRGEFRHGLFYTALALESDSFARDFQDAIALDARAVLMTEIADVRGWLGEFYTHMGEDRIMAALAAADDQTVWRAFTEHAVPAWLVYQPGDLFWWW